MVVINDVIFHGQLNPYNVLEAICSGFNDLPSSCVSFLTARGIKLDKMSESGRAVRIRTAIIVVVLLVLLNGCLVYVWRKNLEKELKAERQT